MQVRQSVKYTPEIILKSVIKSSLRDVPGWKPVEKFIETILNLVVIEAAMDIVWMSQLCSGERSGRNFWTACGPADGNDHSYDWSGFHFRLYFQSYWSYGRFEGGLEQIDVSSHHPDEPFHDEPYIHQRVNHKPSIKRQLVPE